MTATLPEAHADAPEPPDRRTGELTARELGRWGWRQLTSMRTALVLLLLLALAAIPGSVIPQEGVDSLKTSRWQAQHPDLTPIYDRLGLFSVYDSAWFAAIYMLLMISLVGCIIPRLLVYWRALRAQPPAAPRHLSRLPVHVYYKTDEAPGEVLARAAAVLKERGYRLRVSTGSTAGESWVAAERGYLREAGNLLFHLAVVVVLMGFATGGLFGYKGGVIVPVGTGFTNNPTQYDDLDPGSLFDADAMEPFRFTLDRFDIDWIDSGPRQGMARGFNAHLTYYEDLDAPAKTYDLRVNHPLSIGGTQVFLIGHGYAPVITVRDGNGDLVYGGPTPFLPEDAGFRSFGVVKVPDARPQPIGLEGLFFPTYLEVNGDPVNVMGEAKNPTISMLAYTGDLGMDDGDGQSIYELDKSKLTQLKKADGSMFRVDLQPGMTVDLPNGAGTVTFEGVTEWTRLQISRTPGMHVTLGGVVLALIGLLLSLFIRPRRVWVRADVSEGGVTHVDVGGLDRSTAGDVEAEVSQVVAGLRQFDEQAHGPAQPGLAPEKENS
ncbi:cytochrome c biogenesis protein ResB [Nocardioides agariphilus]